MIPQVIEGPSPLGLRPSGLEDAPEALRRAALHHRPGSPDAVRIDVPPLRRRARPRDRDPESARHHGGRPRCCQRRGRHARRRRFPVLPGGDCSTGPGPLPALRRPGRYGLAFPDGHAGLQHPGGEPDGEVASPGLAVATGRGPDLPTGLDGLRPLARDEDAALAGYRVLDDNGHYPGEHIRSTAITVVDLTEARETGTGRVLEKTLATATKPDLKGFWVHLDVDVLDDALMPAVDYRHPGGGIAQRLSDLITDTVPRPAGDAGPDRPRHP